MHQEMLQIAEIPMEMAIPNCGTHGGGVYAARIRAFAFCFGAILRPAVAVAAGQEAKKAMSSFLSVTFVLATDRFAARLVFRLPSRAIPSSSLNRTSVP